MSDPVEQSRPDGYPRDEKFDEAAGKVLDRRGPDEKRAEKFLRSMDERLRARRSKVTPTPGQ